MVGKLRAVGIVAVMAALLLNSIVSIAMTGLSVSDSDPTTYVIVVMLMLFLFLVFYLKDETIVPELKRRNLIYGSALFALYIVATAYARVWLSYLFISYSVNALLLPLFLASAIVTVFGTAGARKMKTMLIYSLFASPIILLPLLNLNSQFALSNAYIVYDLARAVGLPLAQSGIVITAPSSYSISITTTCADIGAFAAMAMFLVPLAYLFDGSAIKKLLWCAAGMALLFLMNVARMFSIVLIWLFYGISSAVSVFHLFIGEVLFSLAIVVMVLLAYKFGLRMPVANARAARQRRPAKAQRGAYAFLLPCIAFGVIGLAISLPYLNSVYLHPLPNNQSAPNAAALSRYVVSTLEYARMNVTQLPKLNSTMLFALGNSANASMQTYVLVGYNQSMQYPRLALPNQISSESLTLGNGLTLLASLVNSSGSTFAVDYFSAPYNASGQPAGLTYEFITRVNATTLQPCAIAGTDPIDYFDSAMYNAFHFQAMGSRALLCESYLIANSIV